MKKNTRVLVKIEDYTAEGFGIARHEGYVLFIPGTIAGETVEALVVKAGKRYGYGKALQIMENRRRAGSRFARWGSAAAAAPSGIFPMKRSCG